MSQDSSGELWGYLGVARGERPAQEPEKASWRYKFPNTLRTVYRDGAGQQPVFEPALLHFPNAYRAGDPRFADAELTRRWLAARRTALDLVLEAVAGCAWAQELMLRGSMLMRSWYRETAREPGDLDFVVLEDSWEVDDPQTDELFTQIAESAQSLADGDGGSVRFDAAAAKSDDIWTYDRVPGCRLMLPWQAEGTPGGWVQLDFVFNEIVPLAPRTQSVTAGSGRPAAELRVASKQLSLAWKLVWLITDMHPQGKDLYDAVLLAEDTMIEYAVLRGALADADENFRARPIGLASFAELGIGLGWDHFQREYPSIQGTAEDWLRRLAAALEPTFTRLAGEPASLYELEAAWLAPLVAELAAATEDRGDGLQDVLISRHVPAAPAIVVTRELVGRDRMSLAEALRAVVGFERRWDTPEPLYAHIHGLEQAARAYGIELRRPWPEHLAAPSLVAEVRASFGYSRHGQGHALEVLAPLAEDPDPTRSAEPVLRAVLARADGRIDRLHCAVQRAFADTP